MSRYTANLSPQESPASQRIDKTALEEEIRPYYAPMRSISGFIGPRSWLSNTHMATLLADGILGHRKTAPCARSCLSLDRLGARSADPNFPLSL